MVHWAANIPISRMAARAPSTNRAGSFSCWARESARSVGSVVDRMITLGSTIAKPRSPSDRPSITEPVLTVVKPKSTSTRPDSSPAMAVPQTASSAPTAKGQIRRIRASGRMPARGSRAKQPRTTTAAETRSMEATSARVISTRAISLPSGPRRPSQEVERTAPNPGSSRAAGPDGTAVVDPSSARSSEGKV